MTPPEDHLSVAVPCPSPAGAAEVPAVTVVRTPAGWSVVSPEGAERVSDLVEGLCLADLVTEQFGGSVEPDRTARRSARGATLDDGTPADDPLVARLAALERTVAQLEHALAARVSTERAIGVLAERHATSTREAFEGLRRAARSQGRAVVDLAREVLDTLPGTAVREGSVGVSPAAVSGPPTPRPPLAGTARTAARARTGADARP